MMNEPIDILAIRKREQAATGGIWAWSENEEGWVGLARSSLKSGDTCVLQGCGEHTNGTILIESEADAQFVARSRQDIPDLLGAILKYGWHDSGCACIELNDWPEVEMFCERPNKQCTCGWRDIHAALAAPLP